MTQWLKNWLAIQETQEMQVRFLDQGDSLEEKMATHSIIIIVWRIPRIEEAGGPQSMWS